MRNIKIRYLELYMLLLPSTILKSRNETFTDFQAKPRVKIGKVTVNHSVTIEVKYLYPFGSA